MADAIDPNKQYGSNELPSDVFNVTSGDVKSFNGQQVKVTVNNNGTRTLTPLQSGLNGYNNDLFSAGVQSTGEIAADLKSSGLLPTNTAPTAPNLEQSYTTLAQQKGVDRIQSDINNLKAQQDEIAAQLRTNTIAEKGKPVAQNVIEGRVSKEQQTAQEQYDFVGRQLSRKTDEMNAAVNSIQTIMQYKQLDYSNAAAAYSQQFEQAISTINLVRGIQNDQKTDVQRATDNARANLQIFTNAITGGNLKYSDIPSDQKAMISKLEVQAGLPVGFTAAIKEKIDPNANIVSTTTNDGQIQVLVRQPDGSLKLQTYGTKNAPSGGSAISANENALKSDIVAKMTLDQVMNKYKNSISPDTILSTYNNYSPWGAAKETLTTLQKKYNVSAPQSNAKLSPTDQAYVKQINDAIANGETTRAKAVQAFPEYASYL